MTKITHLSLPRNKQKTPLGNEVLFRPPPQRHGHSADGTHASEETLTRQLSTTLITALKVVS